MRKMIFCESCTFKLFPLRYGLTMQYVTDKVSEIIGLGHKIAYFGFGKLFGRLFTAVKYVAGSQNIFDDQKFAKVSETFWII